eukprot:3121847-Rhodomonas_salina.1
MVAAFQHRQLSKLSRENSGTLSRPRINCITAHAPYKLYRTAVIAFYHERLRVTLSVPVAQPAWY